MSPLDPKELSPQHRHRRARRLSRLKKSVEANRYRVSATLVAQGIMAEAESEAACRRIYRLD